MSLNGVSDSEKRPVDFSVFAVLYSVDRAASRYKFFEITNLTLFFMYLFIYFFSLHVSSVTVLIIRGSNYTD